MAQIEDPGSPSAPIAVRGHQRWVRTSHWLIALSFLTLAVTGVLILAVHPRLYWGNAGNDLMPALLEIPISDNHQPERFEPTVTFDELPGAPVSADRTYRIFNQNGWGRSLHFLAAWALVTAGFCYVLIGALSGHAWRDLLPRIRDLAPTLLWRDLQGHLRPAPGSVGAGLPYGRLQKLAYTLVVFVALPLMLITGLTMSPTVTAAFPFLLDVFGGYQSARTVHFFGFSFLFLFLVIHVAMVFVTGARRQLRAMILGK